MVGKTLKSKISGSLFYVEDLKKFGEDYYYIILELSTYRRIAIFKELFEEETIQDFEEETIQNFEVIK